MVCDKQSDYNVEIDFQNDTKAGNLQEVQELYRKTSSIEAHQVATDLEEATGIKIQEDIEFQEIPGFMVQEILGIRNYRNSFCVTIGRKYMPYYNPLLIRNRSQL